MQKYSLVVELERLTDEELRYYQFGHPDISVGNEFRDSKCEDKNEHALFMRSVRRLFYTLQPGESQLKHMTNCSTKRLRPVDVTSDDIRSADEIDDLPVFEDEAFIQEKTREAGKFSKPVGSPVLSYGKEISQEFENPVNKCEGKTLSCLMENQNVSVGVDGNLDPSSALKLKNKYKKLISKSKRLKKRNKSLKFIQYEMQQIILKYEKDVKSQNSSQEVDSKSDRPNYSLESKNKLLEEYVKVLENTCKKAKSKSKQLRKRNKKLKLANREMQQKILKYEKILINLNAT